MKIRNMLLSLGASMLLGLSIAPASAASVVRVPDCKYAGQEMSVDLSTTTPMNWSVTSLAHIVGGPTALTAAFGPWSALPTYWIQPQAIPGPANSNFTVGDYIYTIQFYLPCDPRNYERLSISGAIAADNSFQAKLNGSLFKDCTTGTCFSSQANFPPFSNPLVFVQGLNTITVIVHNNETYTGLAAQIKLVAVCGKQCCITLPRRGEIPDRQD